MSSSDMWWRLGAISAASAVGLGAFGAHALKSSGASDYHMKIWETATLYQFIHALGILFVATRSLTRPSSKLDWSATLFTAGTLLFSGSLYLMTLTHKKWLGAITPIGGTAFIAGWVFAALG